MELISCSSKFDLNPELLNYHRQTRCRRSPHVRHKVLNRITPRYLSPTYIPVILSMVVMVSLMSDMNSSKNRCSLEDSGRRASGVCGQWTIKTSMRDRGVM